MRSEGCLPLVACSDVNIYSSQHGGRAWCRPSHCPAVEEVGDKWNRVPILLSNLVEVPEVYTEFAGYHPFSSQREWVYHLVIEMIR